MNNEILSDAAQKCVNELVETIVGKMIDEHFADIFKSYCEKEPSNTQEIINTYDDIYKMSVERVKKCLSSIDVEELVNTFIFIDAETRTKDLIDEGIIDEEQFYIRCKDETGDVEE